MKKLIFTSFMLLLVSEGGLAASSEPAWGRDGMLVTSVGPAAWAGQQVLEKGAYTQQQLLALVNAKPTKK